MTPCRAVVSAITFFLVRGNAINKQVRTNKDYPIKSTPRGVQVSFRGHLLRTGPPAEKMRSWLVNYPEVYIQSVVPCIRARESTFKQTELWSDPQYRIHSTNRRMARRMRRHIAEDARD